MPKHILQLEVNLYDILALAISTVDGESHSNQLFKIVLSWIRVSLSEHKR